MGFFELLAGKLGYVSKQKAAQPYVFPGSNFSVLGLFSGSGKDVDPKNAMESYNSWVFACARAIGEEIAKTKFKLFQINKDQTQEEIFDHELLDLINQPNPFMVGWEMKFMLAVHLELVGKAYIWLENVEKDNQTPTALYPLLPQYVKPVISKTPPYITGYEYKLDDQEKKTYPVGQVVCIRYPNPNKLFDGLGVPMGIPHWIDSDTFAQEFNRKFFENGARIGGFLKSANYQSPEMLEYMARAFHETYAGVKNAYKIVAMPEGTDFQEGQQTQKDMDFVEGQRDSRDKILAGFRVPKTVLGITEDVNRANAEATDYVFAVRTIKPKLELITSFLNAYLVPRFGDNLVLDFVDPTPQNVDLEIKYAQASVAGQPWKSINEVREMEGLPPIDNGDSVMTDFTKTPLGQPSKTVKTNRPTAKNLKPAKKKSPEKDAADKLAKEAAKAIQEVATFKFTKEMTKEQQEAVWKAFVGRVTPYEHAMAKIVRKANTKWIKEVINNLPNITKAVNKKDLFDREAQIGFVIDLTDPVMSDLYQNEGEAAAEFVGSQFTLTEEMKTALKRSIELMAESYTETTLDLLQAKLEEGITAGEGIRELTARVQDIRDFSDTSRAEMVARTETFRTANDAAKSAWKETGVVKSVRWYTAGDEKVCEFCDPMDGTIINIDESFFDQGEQVTGREGGKLDLSYSDVENPPLHPSCRCEIMPEDISITE